MQIKAVFFDLYETLVTEFDPNWQPQPSLADRLGIRAEVFEAEWRARRDARMTGAQRNFQDVLRAICASVDHEVDQDMLEQLSAERLANKAAPFVHIEEDVVRMLHDIHRANVKVGLISNCAPEEVASWETSQLAEYFDDTLFSFQLGCAKPEARIYRLACERLSVEPERSIFVGDGGSDELAGAERVGLTPFHATWFIDRWPAWRRADPAYKAAARFTRLCSPADAVAVVNTGNQRW